jgi:FkbM family methyltransferase
MSVVRALTVSVVNRVPGPFAAPFRSGGLLARTAAPVLERLLPTELTEVLVRSGPGRGLRLQIDARHEKYYWTGAYERAVQEAFEALLRPGDVVWDVGAHIGFFSLLASRLVGPNGSVHAFEPIPANRERLLASLELNRTRNVTVHDCVLSDRSGDCILFPGSASTTWTLVEPGDGEGIPIRSTTLDEFGSSGPPPTLVKIDAERAEVDVLRGGLDLIAEHRPKLLVEFHDGQLLAASRDLLPGYDFRPLDVNHWLLVERR